MSVAYKTDNYIIWTLLLFCKYSTRDLWKCYEIKEPLKNWKDFLLFSIFLFFTVPQGSLNKPNSILKILALFGRWRENCILQSFLNYHSNLLPQIHLSKNNLWISLIYIRLDKEFILWSHMFWKCVMIKPSKSWAFFRFIINYFSSPAFYHIT